MCEHCEAARSARKRRLFTKEDFSPEEEEVYQTILSDYVDSLGPVEDDIEEWINNADPEDLESLDEVRTQLDRRTGDYTDEFSVVFREGGEEGTAAGRALAARQHSLSIAFDIVPEQTLDVIDDWAETASGSTLETITENSARWLRGAHKEGLGIDEIADRLNDELFEGRLEGYVAERAARTGTIATSNAGHHSAMRDASGVIGEEWLTTLDGRERDDHADANGQIVAVETPFEVGGAYLDHPGDPTGPVGQIVNCRCTVSPVFASDLTEAELATLQDGGRLKIVSGETWKLAPGGDTVPVSA
jgi:hypothetical protein